MYNLTQRNIVTMNVNPIVDIRNTSRDLLKCRRRAQRDEITGYPRNVETSRCQQNVIDIIEKLKTKSPISVQELNLLKNALFENMEYTELLLGVHGALRGLIREFTGTDIRRQCEAANCFCNLALGNNKACHAIAKTAGTYLVASLDSMSTDLAVTSIWTIGNLLSSDVRTCDILSAQGAISKLTDTLSNTKVDVIRDGVLYALEHFLLSMKQDLSEEALQKIFQALKWTPENTEFSQLLFLMSCHPKFPSLVLFDDNFIENLLNTYFNVLQMQCNNGEQVECPNFVYITRILANICIFSIVCNKVLDGLVKSNISTNAFSLCNTKIDSVRNTQLWFLGNLLNFSSDNDLKRSFFSITF